MAMNFLGARETVSYNSPPAEQPVINYLKTIPERQYLSDYVENMLLS